MPWCFEAEMRCSGKQVSSFSGEHFQWGERWPFRHHKISVLHVADSMKINGAKQRITLQILRKVHKQTLKCHSRFTKKGNEIAWRILFSFNVCSTCFSLTTCRIKDYFTAWVTPVGRHVFMRALRTRRFPGLKLTQETNSTRKCKKQGSCVLISLDLCNNSPSKRVKQTALGLSSHAIFHNKSSANRSRTKQRKCFIQAWRPKLYTHKNRYRYTIIDI